MEESPLIKTCIKCMRELPLEQFRLRSNVNAAGERKRRGDCDDCRREYLRQRKSDRRDIENAAERERYWANPDHARKLRRESAARNRERVRDSNRQYYFGVEPGWYDEILQEQGGVCAICLQPEKIVSEKSGEVRSLHIDHNHVTGEIRGLLCTRCNLGIGYFEDDPDKAKAAADYLRSHRSLGFVTGQKQASEHYERNLLFLIAVAV